MKFKWWIDISTILSNLIQITPKEIQSIDLNIKSISISNGNCNNSNYTIFNFSRFNSLEELIIGNDCFCSVNLFKIDGLNELKSIKIGMNSFTKKKNSNGDDTSRSFHILNCAELKSIEIGLFSFSDYSGGFELINLPKLESIKIGEIGSNSYNFYYSSFEIKGIIDMILLMNRSSKFEFYWIRWWGILWIIINNNIKYLNDLNEWYCRSSTFEFHQTRWICTCWERWWILFIENGKWYRMNELIIDLTSLTTITSNGYSFSQIRSITLSSNILNNWILNRYFQS